MGNARRKLLLNAFKVFDLGLMILAFVVAALFVVHQSSAVSVTEFFSMRVKVQNLAIFSLFILAWHMVFSLSGLYTSRRLSNRRGEVIDVMKSNSMGTFVILFGAIAFHLRMATPSFLFVFWLVSTCMIVSSRLMLRVILEFVRKRGRNLRNIIIVGTGGRAMEFAR